MNILSFETASYFGGVALLADSEVETRGPFEPRGASRAILAAADELLQRRGLAPRQLDALAVSTGPGLFTGVRVGLALAKTLAWAGGDDAPALIGVPTLQAVALQAADQEEPAPAQRIAAITDARRGEVYGALFEIDPDDRTPRFLGREIVARPARLPELLAAEAQGSPAVRGALTLAGDGAERYRETLTEAFRSQAPDAAPRLAAVTGRNLAEAVLDLARRRFEAGDADDPASLSPDYVRRPDARRPVVKTDL